MIAKVSSVAITGMVAHPVEVEVDVTSSGLPDFHIVGLPSSGLREAAKRVRSAIINSQQDWPNKRIVANLAPGDLRKDGPAFDLPLAMGVLAANGVVKGNKLGEHFLVGELALDGRLRPVRGVLSATMAAKEGGARGVVVPAANVSEAALVPSIDVYGAKHLVDAVAYLNGEMRPLSERVDPNEVLRAESAFNVPDPVDVKGQALAKRALEIAAAGPHNMLMVGPPGSGKTMLAKRLPGILPPLTLQEALEVTRVWSVAGLLTRNGKSPLVTERPFRSPHHNASAAGVIGGGHRFVKPGEVSLAHHGVLFLDEMPLFSPMVMEALRQPLEEGFVTVVRSGTSERFPAEVCLVGAANPCMCSHSICECAAGRLRTYRARLSGPLLDRIDLHVEVGKLTVEEQMEVGVSEDSATIRARVMRARESRVGGEPDPKASALRPQPRKLLHECLSKNLLSARGVTRSLRVARTISRLEGGQEIEEQHLAEALQFRRGVWEMC